MKKTTLNIPRYLFGKGFLFEEFIRPTTQYESDPMLAAVYQAPLIMNTVVPNVIYHDTYRHLAACPYLPGSPSKISVSEKQVLSQASVFCPQTTVSDPISATAYLFFLIKLTPFITYHPKQEALTVAAAA